ncbi:MAG: 2-dehydropantoate 2-reductase [Candidatus Acidiferrales bacterium]
MPEPASAPQAHPYKRVAVMGTGAVGGYFGGMLARAGTSVTFIARPATASVISQRGLFIDSPNFQETIRAKASSEPSAVANAELVLFCVKTTDTESVAKTLLPHLAPGAVVLSLQNGVDNAEQLEAAGIHALPAVVYVAASVPEPGRIKHSERGDLAIGGPANRRADLERIAATFAKAGVACKISENIQADLWSKFVFNCALNAISAIAQVGYGPVVQNDWSRETTLAAARETIAVAQAVGIELPEKDILERLIQFALKVGPVTSSTAQDIGRRKHTEIDSLNAYVVRRGAALGVPTPVNHTLTALLKLIEEKF